jgi:hypothetical protein
MIVLDLWRLSHLDAPGYVSHGTLAQCEEWRDTRRMPGDLARDRYVLERKPACGCCGRHWLKGSPEDSLTVWLNGAVRCADHWGRNPCAIEGCKRTRAAPTYSAWEAAGEPFHADDQTLCAEHWRAYVPPRSRLRRAYHAYFAQAKRHGWGWKGKSGRSARLDWRFHRFWDALVKMARRRATDGFVDEAAINRLMGWE